MTTIHTHIDHAPFPIRGRRLLLLADQHFSPVEAKTAVCLLMYRSDDTVAVVDRETAGSTTHDVVGLGGDTPVVASVSESPSYHPEVAVVGTAPMGGALDGDFRDAVAQCLDAGVDVVSGLHVFLKDDPELVRRAQAGGAKIWDVRDGIAQRSVSTGVGCVTGADVVLTVGTDCNVGKMTVTAELSDALNRRGVKSSWAATGQTGMMLRERGVAVDRVIADFIGGATEHVVNAEGVGQDIVVVEGQGSILHPGYAGVTAGLMFGAMPDAMVLVHALDRSQMKRLDIPLPAITDIIDIHNRMMKLYKPARVVAVALNSSMVSESAAKLAVERVGNETGLPTTDMIRFGPDVIADAVLEALPRDKKDS